MTDKLNFIGQSSVVMGKEPRLSLLESVWLCLFTSAQPNVSGLHDFDYPSLLEAGVGLDALPELTTSKRLPLPPELTEQFDRILPHLG